LIDSGVSSKYTAISFKLVDVASLEIQNFSIDSIKSYGQAAGYSLFEFVKKETFNRDFYLNVDGFTVNGFIFNEVNVFEIPLRNAKVEMKNIEITNSYFRNSFLLNDIYHDTASPLKDIHVNNLLVNNTQFSQQSGIFNLPNVNRFLLEDTTI
jgi:hypothetical protein